MPSAQGFQIVVIGGKCFYFLCRFSCGNWAYVVNLNGGGYSAFNASVTVYDFVVFTVFAKWMRGKICQADRAVYIVCVAYVLTVVTAFVLFALW